MPGVPETVAVALTTQDTKPWLGMLGGLIAVLILLPLEIAFGYLRWLAENAAGFFAGMGGMKAASPIKIITKPTIGLLMHLLDKNPILCLIVALALMYLALKFLVDLAKGIVIKRAERHMQRYLFGAAPQAMFFGVLMTIMVQSSSITTSMIVPLIGADDRDGAAHAP